MHVSTYVCIYVCVYVRMYVCMYVRTYACMYICMYVCMYYICMYVFMYVYMYVRMYVCMHACKYLHVQAYLNQWNVWQQEGKRRTESSKNGLDWLSTDLQSGKWAAISVDKRKEVSVCNGKCSLLLNLYRPVTTKCTVFNFQTKYDNQFAVIRNNVVESFHLNMLP
jgi:hypothetical protein